MERLFLLEILTEKIRLCNAYNPLPPKHDIIITIIFGDITMKIADDDSANDTVDPESLEIEFNTGKSVLFPSTCESLLQMMNSSPLILNIEYKSILISSVSIPWSDLFTYMVENSEENSLPPVSNKSTYMLLNNRSEKIGEVQLFMRLSSFGKNIQTGFKVVQSNEGNSKKFFFKGPEKSAVFQTQRSPSNVTTCNEMRSSCSNTIHVSPMSKTIIEPTVKISKPALNKVKNLQNVSQSVHSAQYSHVRYQGSQMSDTLVWRKKIENVMFTSPAKQIQQIQKLSYAPSRASVNNSQSYNKLNNNRFESISNLKEMCQTGESYYCFGPNFHQKHYSTQNINRPKTAIFSGDSQNVSGFCNGCQKLYGGSPPLRLKGGGPGIFDELPILHLPTPSDACKDLMDEIDQCLQAFKNAMGPCGKVYCPYAPNVTSEICKRVCECKPSDGNEGEEAASEIEPDSPIFEKFNEPDSLFPECYRTEHQNDLLSACGVPTCPFSRQPDEKPPRRKPYCQSATCPMAKQRIGEKVDEHKVWMQQLGPTFGERCGQPNRCPYPIVSKPLPPIHWECPEALPKGQCQNPSCPYTPGILRKKVPPCGNMNCRHSSSTCICCTCVPLPACGNPNCPNAKPVCAPCPEEPPKKEPSCANPKCPNKPKPEEIDSKLPKCTCADIDGEDCDNPTCPFKLTHICGNSSCPFNSPKKRRNSSASSSKPIRTSFPKNEGTFDSQFPDERLKPCKKSGEFSSNGRIRGGCDEGSRQNKGGCEGRRQVCSGKDCCNPQKENSKGENPKEYDCGSVNPSVFSADNGQCDNPNCPFKSIDFCTNETCGKTNPSKSCNNNKESKSKTCVFNKDEPFICNDPACPWAIPCIPCPTCLPPCPPPCSPCPPCPPCPACLPCPYTQPCPFENPCSYLYPDLSRKTDPCAELLNKKVEEEKSEPCKNETCKSKGGDKPCKTCSKQTTANESKSNAGGGGGDNAPEKPSTPQKPPYVTKSTAVSTKSEPQSKDAVKKKRTMSRKFAYFIGDQYPGNTVGHTHCIIPGKQVPHNKGWLWNVHVPCLSLKRRRGWKPGLIGRTIATRIQQYWHKKGIKSLTVPPVRTIRRMKGGQAFESSSDESIPPQSTLQVKKRNGTYWITMNPLKDPFKIADNENPYMDCTPMQFKITKKDNRQCFCGDDEEDESDSELDIDFTPPAGIIRPERLKKKRTIAHEEAQYDPKDFAPPKAGGKGKGKGKGKDGKKKKGKK